MMEIITAVSVGILIGLLIAIFLNYRLFKAPKNKTVISDFTMRELMDIAKYIKADKNNTNMVTSRFEYLTALLNKVYQRLKEMDFEISNSRP